MATMKIPPDFKEFLKLLNANNVKYLLIGGYAVGYYGYPRPTGDMDIWISIDEENAEKTVNLISLQHLKINKKASGRYKDLNDLENLP